MVSVLILAGVLYSYALWNAVAFLVTHAADGLSPYGWFVLVFAVVFPLLVFGAVYAIGHARRIRELAMLALAGLGVVAVFWLNVLAHFVVSESLFLS